MISLFPGHCSLKFVQFLHVNCNDTRGWIIKKAIKPTVKTKNLPFYVSVNTSSEAGANYKPPPLHEQHY